MQKAHLSQLDTLADYAIRHSLRLDEAQKSLIDETVKLGSSSRMLGSADSLQLLANLCRSIGAKRTLDIGMFTGYSALTIAQALPHDGELITCDVSDAHEALARRHWQLAGVDAKISVRIGPAADTLRSLLPAEEDAFDFAFIDADKTGYLDYYELCLRLIRPGGIIAVDNVLWMGQVCDDSDKSESTVALREFNEFVANDNRVYISMLVSGDGITLAFVK